MTTLGIELQENGTEHYRRFIREDLDCYLAIVRKLRLQIAPQ